MIINPLMYGSGEGGLLLLDPESETPFVFGVDSIDGFYMSPDEDDETAVYAGRNENNELYVRGELIT